jgi:hypothetical protein
MKLEIKHLSCYLPYGLKAKMNIFGDNETEVEIFGINQNEVELKGIRKTITEFFNINDISPILRPLSDLTKEIEVNGEKFVPYDYFFNDPDNDWFEGNIWMGYLFEGNIDKLEIGFIPYYIIQKLAEWHIDFQGLIPAGLAIDKTTLK